MKNCLGKIVRGTAILTCLMLFAACGSDNGTQLPEETDANVETTPVTESAEQETVSGTENIISENDEIKQEFVLAEIDKGFKVVGYYPSWEPDNTDKIRYDIVTHVNYAFAIPTVDGGLLPLENPETAKKIIEEAHAADRKVLLAVGGWSYQDVPLESTFVEATETAEKRTSLVQAIVDMCEEYGFDGIDMDWEHPRADGKIDVQYEAFMLELAEALHGRGKLLTSAVISGVMSNGMIYYDAAAHTDAVLEAVDWINVMAYDGGDGQAHSGYEFATSSAAYWVKYRNMPGEKVVLGVPFYGRPTWATYETLLDADAEAADKDTTIYNGFTVWYNGQDTIRSKTEFAMENLGGIMIWELSQDTTDREKSLLTVIGETIAAAQDEVKEGN